MAWYIKYGMGGGYGGSELTDWEKVDVDTKEEADAWAYESACEEFESSGEFDYDDFHNEYPDATEEDEWEAYCLEREFWIFYFAEEFNTNPNEE